MQHDNLSGFNYADPFFSTLSKTRTDCLMDDQPVLFILKSEEGPVWVRFSRRENPVIVATTYQVDAQFNSELTENKPVFVSTKNQIDSLRKIMGFNISEIATILHVSRPTIYEWVETDISVRGHNQKRLNDIYDFCLFWGKKNIGNLTAYLHKKSGDKSLFMMFTEKKLDKEKIYYVLNQIEQLILKDRLRRSKSDLLLKQHGFEDISEEELEKNFNKNIRSIG